MAGTAVGRTIEGPTMLSTMGDVDITIPMLFHFGRTVFPSSVVRPVLPKLSQDAR